MGQRHQAFLIARVRPHGTPPTHRGNRRCIAAFHHQWCYGSGPLTATRRLVTLISQPENAAIVRAELRAIDGKYGDYGSVEPCIPDIPCPFTASLLASAWTVDLDHDKEYYGSGTTPHNSLLEAGMGCWDGDNNDGISVIDITDPTKPSYCFLLGKTPLDARGYLGDYYPCVRTVAGVADTKDEGDHAEDSGDDSEDPDEIADEAPDDVWRQHLDRSISNLDDVPVISATLLREAWPGVTFKDARNAATLPQPVAAKPSVAVVPRLADMALEVSVKHAVQDGDTAELEKLIWLPGKAALVKTVLRGLKPLPTGVISLLSMTLLELKETTCIDLSELQLSGTELVELLSAFDDVSSLDLSYNETITAEDVPHILAAAPNLRRLVLMGCSSVQDQSLLDLVISQPSFFKNVEGILHPAFLTIHKPEHYPCAFVYPNINSYNFTCHVLPFFTPAQIIQAVIDLIPWKNDVEDFYGMKSPMVGFAVFQAAARKPSRKFSQRSVVTVPMVSPRIPRGVKEFWMFVCHVPDTVFKPSIHGWAFVRYTPLAEDPSNVAGGTESGTSLEECTSPKKLKDEMLGYWVEPHDLQSFLDCMRRDGRPMPSDDAVKQLEELLAKENPETGKLYCPMIKDDSLLKISRRHRW